MILLVTDIFILLTVHGIFSHSIIYFALEPYSTAGKTVVYSSLTFVLVETSKTYDFWQICHCWFAQTYSFLGLFIGVADIGDENYKKLQLVTVLISSPFDKMFTFSNVLIFVVLYRFILRPNLSRLFLTHFISSIMSSLLSTSGVVSSMCLWCLFFMSPF